MQLDPAAPDFAQRLGHLIGGQAIDAGQVHYAEAIRDGRGSNMPCGKPVLRADDFLPEKHWHVLASVGYMCDDPYTGAAGVEQVDDDVYRVTTRLATRKASSRDHLHAAPDGAAGDSAAGLQPAARRASSPASITSPGR